jgi:hypothetical protein
MLLRSEPISPNWFFTFGSVSEKYLEYFLQPVSENASYSPPQIIPTIAPERS